MEKEEALLARSSAREEKKLAEVARQDAIKEKQEAVVARQNALVEKKEAVEARQTAAAKKLLALEALYAVRTKEVEIATGDWMACRVEGAEPLREDDDIYRVILAPAKRMVHHAFFSLCHVDDWACRPLAVVLV